MELVHMQLLDRDIERLINLAIFFLLFWVGARILFAIRRKTQNRSLQSACMAVTLAVFFFLALELFTRIVYFARHGEVNFLVYPIRTVTRDYINLNWTPLYYFNKDGGLPDDTIPTVTRTFASLAYYRATQNEMGFRFDASRYPKDTFNIVCIGGSSTWGMNSDGQTYPDYLQDFLKKDKVKVYNLGKRGHQSHQFLDDLIKSQLMNNIRIDLVIFYAGYNDSHTHYRSFEGFKRIRNAYFLFIESNSLPKYSLLARNISLLGFSNKFHRMFDDALRKKAPIPMEGIQSRKQNFRNNLMRLVNYIQEHNNPGIQAVGALELTNFIVPITEFRKRYKPGDFQKAGSIENYKTINYELLTKDQALQDLAREFPYFHYFDIGFLANLDPDKLLSDSVHLRSYGNRILGQELGDFTKQLFLSGKKVNEVTANPSLMASGPQASR